MPHNPARHAAARGFTLTEMLTVIAIVGVLAAILIPVVSKARQSSRTAACLSNLRQVGVGFRLHAADNQGALPVQRANKAPYAADASWSGRLHPYLSGYAAMACSEHSVNPATNLPPITYNYNPWVAGQGSERPPVRLSQSANPGKDVLMVDNASWEAGRAFNYNEGMVNMAVTLTYLYPHGGKRSILYVDGHVDLRVADIDHWTHYRWVQ